VAECRMPVVQVEHYLQRAADFFYGMRLMCGDDSYRNSSALLAIHSAVSYSDALRVGLGEQKRSADDHSKAVDALQNILPSKQVSDQSGFGHLRFLISNKSRVAYGSQTLTAKELEMLLTKAERFASWANTLARRLKIEGWTHDDQ
jgi:hypothetical protein